MGSKNKCISWAKYYSRRLYMVFPSRARMISTRRTIIVRLWVIWMILFLSLLLGILQWPHISFLGRKDKIIRKLYIQLCSFYSYTLLRIYWSWTQLTDTWQSSVWITLHFKPRDFWIALLQGQRKGNLIMWKAAHCLIGKYALLRKYKCSHGLISRWKRWLLKLCN